FFAGQNDSLTLGQNNSLTGAGKTANSADSLDAALGQNDSLSTISSAPSSPAASSPDPSSEARWASVARRSRVNAEHASTTSALSGGGSAPARSSPSNPTSSHQPRRRKSR